MKIGESIGRLISWKCEVPRASVRIRTTRRPVMRHVFLALTTLIVASGGNTAFAQYDCPGGQRPVPPAVAERMALPLCGFDATKRWAGNMCQLCDSRNMYPNPFVAYRVPRGRYYELR